MKQYIVTATLLNRPYRERLSKPLPLSKAKTLKNVTERNMEIAIPKYQWCKDIQIEETAQ